MAVATSTALLLSAGIAAGSAYYQAEKQEDIAEEQQRKLDIAEDERIAEAERIARETRPEGETVEGIKFGAATDNELGSVSDFLIPKTSALGTSGSSGLGFAV